MSNLNVTVTMSDRFSITFYATVTRLDGLDKTTFSVTVAIHDGVYTKDERSQICLIRIFLALSV